jgi:hypothetical protein
MEIIIMTNLFYSMPTLACYANDNDALVPELWAQESLVILEENMVMAGLVHRDFSPEVAKFGDYVHTRRPGTFSVKRKTDTDTVTNQDAVATDVQVPLDQHMYVSFTIKDGEASKSFKDLVEMYLQPAAMEIASSVDRVLCGQAHRFLANRVGSLTEMSSTTSKDTLLEGRELLNENKAHVAGRNLVISPGCETELLKTELFISAEKRGDAGTALREASLGRVLGFDTYMDQNVPSITKASADYVDGVTDEAEPLAETTINLTVLALAHVATAGEFIWLEGEGRPHVISTVTDDGTNTTAVTIVDPLEVAVASGAVVTVYKKCAVSGNYAAGYAKEITLTQGGAFNIPQQGQLLAFGTGTSRHTYTVISAVADGNDVDVLLDRPLESSLTTADPAFPGPAGGFNMAFHRNSIALVSRPLALPNNALGVRSAIGSYNDVTMRVAMQYDISQQGTVVTLDLLCGVALLDANLGCLVLS